MLSCCFSHCECGIVSETIQKQYELTNTSKLPFLRFSIISTIMWWIFLYYHLLTQLIFTCIFWAETWVMRHLIISVLEKLESNYLSKQLKKFLKIIFYFLHSTTYLQTQQNMKVQVTNSTERTFILDKELKGKNPAFLLEPRLSWWNTFLN